MSPFATPNLSRLSIYNYDYGFWARIEDIFSSSATRTVTFSSCESCVGQDLEGPHFFQIASSNCAAKLQRIIFPPQIQPQCDWFEDISYFRDNQEITHLALPIGLDSMVPMDDSYQNSPFQVFCDTMGTLSNLQALWVCWVRYPNMKHCTRSAEMTAELQRVILQLAGHCSRLSYIRVGKMAWRIHPAWNMGANDGCCLEELDGWEDQVEGPADFHAPSPLPWSDWVQHAEW